MKEVPLERVREAIAQENPWWASNREVVFDLRGMRSRAFLPQFVALVRQQVFNRAVLLMGPRRVGKTVMLQQAVHELIVAGVKPSRILMLSVDHPAYLGRGLEMLIDMASDAGPEGFDYVFFDEIQYLRDWQVHLKVLVDRYPKMRFVASGSGAAALRVKSRESGAGRFTDFYLPPLTFAEYLDLTGRIELARWQPHVGGADPARLAQLNAEFVRYINYGGYPEVALRHVGAQDLMRFVKGDIIDKVLLKDLPSLYGIQDVQELNQFFVRIAINTGEELSWDGLSQASGAAKNTIRRYIEFLEASFLVRRVFRVDRAGKRFQRETRLKVYLTNPSMRAALFGPVDADHADMGHLVETAYFNQWVEGRDALCYGRWGNEEIDVIGLGATLEPAFATEMKWSDAVVRNADRELRTLVRFAKDHALPVPICSTRTHYALDTVDGTRVAFVPAALLCLMVGRSQVAHNTAETLAEVLA